MGACLEPKVVWTVKQKRRRRRSEERGAGLPTKSVRLLLAFVKATPQTKPKQSYSIPFYHHHLHHLSPPSSAASLIPQHIQGLRGCHGCGALQGACVASWKFLRREFISSEPSVPPGAHTHR